MKIVTREVRPGDTVRVRCADGSTRIKTAMTACVDGLDFPVVWVAGLGSDWRKANHDARPWPCEDVQIARGKKDES